MLLRDQASSALVATSVLLIFVTLLFTIRYPEIAADLAAEDLGDKAREKKRRAGELKVRLKTHLLPVVVGSAALAYLQAPLAIEIMSESVFEPWSFDILLTATVLIEFWVVGLATWSIVLTGLMIRKIRRLRADN